MHKLLVLTLFTSSSLISSDVPTSLNRRRSLSESRLQQLALEDAANNEEITQLRDTINQFFIYGVPNKEQRQQFADACHQFTNHSDADIKEKVVYDSLALHWLTNGLQGPFEEQDQNNGHQIKKDGFKRVRKLYKCGSAYKQQAKNSDDPQVEAQFHVLAHAQYSLAQNLLQEIYWTPESNSQESNFGKLSRQTSQTSLST